METLSIPGLTLLQLRTFVAVVESESFTRAGARLSLTQPAVSAQIQHLREFVGLPLVTREGRRVLLTDAGRVLYDYAREVLARTETLQRQVAELASGETDRIIVGANRSYTSILLPPLLARFGLAHPGLRISLRQSKGRELVELVQSNQVDLAISASKGLQKELILAPLGTDAMVVVEAASAPFSQGRALTLAEFCRLPFLRSNTGDAQLSGGMDQALAQQGLPFPRVVFDSQTWQGVLEAAKAGLGLTMLLRSTVREAVEQRTLRVVEIPDFEDTRSMCLLCSPQRRRTPLPVFAELADLLGSELKSRFGPAGDAVEP
jgi:LysR family transcriptional regulator, carnitine catabolism transcriptional activator